MTFLEALAELGIEPTQDTRAARRAYLRLLKERTPERDPEGFKRLRQAYELAVAGLDEISEIARTFGAENMKAGPEEPEASDGIDLSLVVERFRVRLNAYEYQSLARTRSMVHALNIVHRLIEQGQSDIAAEISIQLIGQAPFDRPPQLPVRLIIRQICRLTARGASAEGRRVAHALEAWLSKSGRELEILSDGLAAVWLLTQELCSLPDGIRPEALRALVTFILEEDHSLAERILLGFVQRHPKDAAKLEELLRTTAPSLYALVDWPRPRLDPKRFVAEYWGWMAAGGLVILVVLFLLLALRPQCAYPPPIGWQ